MEKYKILAVKEQLENIGIDYDITNLIGVLENRFPTCYYALRVKHKVGDMEFTNTFDIPKYYLKKV